MRRQTVSLADAVEHTTTYDSFRGVEYAADESAISYYHSPDALNLVSDAKGFPEKRVGWRAIAQGNGCVNGIYFQPATKLHRIPRYVHIGTQLYELDDNDDLQALDGAAQTMADAPSYAIPFGGFLLLLDGANYMSIENYDVSKIAYISGNGATNGFIPTTSVLCEPTGGGTSYQAVNLCSPLRYNQFVTDGVAKSFRVDTGVVDENTYYDCWNMLTGEKYDKSAYTVDCATGTFTFETAPEASANAGTDALKICFCHVVPGYVDRINKCRFGCTFGADADNRVFLSGNPDYPNRIFYSALNDCTYFPDTNYQDVGVENFAVTALLKSSNGEMVILKEQNDAEANIWHMEGRISQDEAINGAYFPMREGVTGLGALNEYAVGVLNDDPMFVSQDGVFAVTTSYSYSKYVSNIARRSAYIDRKLMFDDDLKNARACVWKNKFMIFCGDHVYVADGTQRRTDGQYEWFYWDNIPAVCLRVFGDKLYFGTQDGRVCVFNSDWVSDNGEPWASAYSDYPVPGNNNGQAIHARWTTRIDGFGDFFREKTILRRGSGLLLKSYARSGVLVSCRILDKFKHELKTFSFNRFSFDDLDFSNFSFVANDSRLCPLRRKIRRFPAIQFIIENDTPNEGFGVMRLTLNWVALGYI